MVENMLKYLKSFYMNNSCDDFHKYKIYKYKKCGMYYNNQINFETYNIKV